MKYMIHSCNKRQWYVDKYLVPSLLEQGIEEKNIYVYQDKTEAGNLVSWIVSCHLAQEMWGDNENVWHLQDDVLVSSKFKERTEELEAYRNIVMCGFTTFYDDGRKPGELPCKNNTWYSFPCIRIRTSISKEFANWCDTYLWRDNQFGFWTRHKKGDDYIFRVWVESYYPDELILNLKPNLVEHVDYLIGGTIINKQRNKDSVRSMYWDENDLVNELMEKLAKENIE